MDAPDWLDRREYPFESHYCELPAGRLHYVDEGRGEGAPLVLLHGQPTWSFMYRKLIRGLAAGHRCIAVDHMGFGLSDKPRQWSYTPRDHAANLGALVDQLGLERVSLLVHDWGGPIGLGWAVEHAERVDRVIALDTWMWSMAEHRAGRLFSHLMGSAAGGWATRRWNLFVEVFLKRALGERFAEVGPAYRGPLARPEDRTGCALFPRELLSPWLAELWERRAALSGKRALLVWGERDPAFPAPMRERLASVFGEARVELQPGVGHFVAEEMGEALVPIVDRFLRE